MIHLALALIATLAFAVSMVAAGGAALVLIPVVRWTLGLEAVAPAITVGLTANGVSRIALLRGHLRWDVIRWYLPAAMLGGFAGALLFTWMIQREDYVEVLRWIIGLFLVSTLLQHRFGKRRKGIPGMRVPWMAPIGFVVAATSGLVGGVGPVLNPFYLSLGVRRQEMVATKAFNALAMHLTKIATYASFGALDLRLLGYGLALGAGAVCGNLIGRRWLEAIGERRFRAVVIWVTAACGVLMLVT